MNLQDMKRKISIFNKMVNENYKHRTETERLLLKSLKISEEVGEFHNEILGYVGYTRSGKEHSREELEKECIDVLLSTMLVADDLGIDIEKVLDEKLEIVFRRFNLKDE